MLFNSQSVSAQTDPLAFPNDGKLVYHQIFDERFRFKIKRARILFETCVPLWSPLQILSNHPSPHFDSCLIGSIEKYVIFKIRIVFVEKSSSSLFEIRVSAVCHLASGQSCSVESTPLFEYWAIPGLCR